MRIATEQGHKVGAVNFSFSHSPILCGLRHSLFPCRLVNPLLSAILQYYADCDLGKIIVSLLTSSFSHSPILCGLRLPSICLANSSPFSFSHSPILCGLRLHVQQMPKILDKSFSHSPILCGLRHQNGKSSPKSGASFSHSPILCGLRPRPVAGVAILASKPPSFFASAQIH